MTYADCSPEPDKLLLVLNGCEERLQAVLGSHKPEGDSLLIAAREWTVPGQSVKHLIPGIQEVLSGLGLTPDHLGAVACTRGPGSFTGMRLVLAAAMGLAAGQNIPVAGIDYLPLLASNIPCVDNIPLNVLTYARRGQVYMQSFENGKACSAPEAMRIGQACELLVRQNTPARVMGSGVRKNLEEIETAIAKKSDLTVIPAEFDNPNPATLLRAGVSGNFAEGDIEPLYLRASDAEDNLPEIARKRGIDPEEALSKLHKYS